MKIAHHAKSCACIGVVIEPSCERERRPFFSMLTSTAKDKRSSSQARTIINRVVDYFAGLKMGSGGPVPVEKNVGSHRGE